MKTLLCFGFGYTAQALARRLRGSQPVRIIGTSRSAAAASDGIEMIAFDGTATSPALDAAIAEATHILVSAPPSNAGDPVLAACAAPLGAAPALRWLGYLSTIGVYGDTGGAWVDEETAPRPHHERAGRRLMAERQWLDFGARSNVAVQIFRLGGIYGPGRNVLEELQAGTARRIVKPGQVFNRVHVDDIVAVIDAALERGRPGGIYNVVDDEPTPSEDVLLYAASLLGMAPPPQESFDTARISPMAASFFADNRRVRNGRIKTELGVALRYSTYREGLDGLYADLKRIPLR